MLFNSIEFLIFFPMVTVIYFLLPHKYRWVHLLLSSCVFYMFFIPVYILILLFTIIIDYYAGIIIEKNTEKRKRRRWLIISIVANVGILAVFKYYNFFIDNVNELVGSDQHRIPSLKIILPIGLSFHTFQAMSYTIEVYRGKQAAQRHFGLYALYVMFYPQLVAGPIERPQNIMHQFTQTHTFDYTRVVSGLRLMLWGFFKKIVVADRLALFVDAVYDNPSDYNGMPFIWSALFFTFQIYCDFSGYSDIARGSARVMGFELMKNFNVPYIATNIRDFWNRWHISLSTWFRDYLYIPLGGNRVSKWKQSRNLLVVFIISGFWHGANWTFIIWGALHGILVVFNNLFNFGKVKTNPIRLFLGWFVTLIFVSTFWVFFRARNLNEALMVFSKSIQLDEGVLFGVPLFTPLFYLTCLIGIFSVFVCEALLENRLSFVSKIFRNRLANYMYFFALCLLIIVFGIFEKQNFIYFQF